MNKKIPVYFFVFSIFILKVNIISAQADTVSIDIDIKKSAGPFTPLWSFFGYDEANYTIMKNGKKLLSELAALSTNPVYVRVHNLLTTGDGKAALKWSSTNVYTEDINGNPVYNWTVVDSIFDVFINRSIKPIAEIGFMPEALSVKPKPYRHHWKPGVPYDSIYTPLDYITFHAKGEPAVVNNSVQMNMAVQLQDVAKGFEIINTFPSLKRLPVIIGEFDPEGCAACSVQFSPQNAYRNGTMYSSYTAASFAQLYAMGKKYNVNLTGAVSWSFEFENQPWFAGFRDLATNGVDKPVLNVFRMFGMMKGNMLEINNSNTIPIEKIIDSSVRGDNPYVNALATLDAHNIYIMLWNYHDDDSKKTDALIKIELQQLPAVNVTVRCFLVDEEHSNSYTLWQKMGSPQQVSEEKFSELKKAAQLQKTGEDKQLKVLNGTINYQLNLAGQGVALLKVSF